MRARGFVRCAGLAAAYVLLFWVAFHLAWPVIFVAVAPLAVAMIASRRGWQAALLAWVAGMVFWASGESFLNVYSPAGVRLLAAWQGLTVALVAVSTRWWHRRFKLPLAWVLPVTWVGAEYLRMLGPFGFPIASLALPCHGQLWMLQVCDLGGLYALSFPLAMVNGLVADLWLAGAENRSAKIETQTHTARSPVDFDDRQSPSIPKRRLAAAAISTLAVWMAVGGYGLWRLAEAEHTVRPGPVVSVVQPDVVYAGNIADGFDRDLLRQQLRGLSEQAARHQPAPHLIVWPEAIGAMPDFNPELLAAPFDERRAAMVLGFRSLGDVPTEERPQLRELWDREREHRRQQEVTLRQWIKTLGVPLLFGSRCWLPTPSGQTDSPWRVYNAAILLTPGGGQSARQFKNRLFPLQEWLPWPNTVFQRWLYHRLAGHERMSPWPWLTPGQERKVFDLRMDGAAGLGAAANVLPEPPVRFVVSLCSESLFPNSTASFLRRAGGAKAADLLINLANEGGFQRNRELPMHFALLPFRAVEARVAVAQSANTGISGFVKPTGAVYGLVTNAHGVAWTGRGAPELPLIAALVPWRQTHADDLGRRPELAAQAQAAIAAIEHLRHEVGIVGQSTQPIYLDSRRSLYSRVHDAPAQLLLALLVLGLLGPLWHRVRARSAAGQG